MMPCEQPFTYEAGAEFTVVVTDTDLRLRHLATPVILAVRNTDHIYRSPLQNVGGIVVFEKYTTRLLAKYLALLHDLSLLAIGQVFVLPFRE